MQNGGSLYLLPTFATTGVVGRARALARGAHYSYLCACSFSMRPFSSASALASRAIARKGAFCSCVMLLHSLAMILAICPISICKTERRHESKKHGKAAEKQNEWGARGAEGAGGGEKREE